MADSARMEADNRRLQEENREMRAAQVRALGLAREARDYMLSLSTASRAKKCLDEVCLTLMKTVGGR